MSLQETRNRIMISTKTSTSTDLPKIIIMIFQSKKLITLMKKSGKGRNPLKI